MRTLRQSTTLLLLVLLVVTRQAAAQLIEPTIEIQGKDQGTSFVTNGMLIFVITNGVTVKYNDASGLTVLTAERATVNIQTEDVFAEGAVRVQRATETWTGDRLHYNFKTSKLDGDTFRSGQNSIFVGGQALHGVGDKTNGTYQGTNVLITTDDYYKPLTKVRAKSFTIVPNKYVEAHDAVLYAGEVPVFYWPYYKHSLEPSDSGWNFVPGYRSLFGPYLLSSYYWMVTDQIKATIHADYREARGPGIGPDLRYNFGNWGEGGLGYYYTHDRNPGLDPTIGTSLPENRQRAYLTYNANPVTNLTFISQVAYQSDPFVLRDFFESQYNRDIQPGTYFDVNKFWRNWSLDALAQPRINPFWETVERLPEVRLTGFRQQVGSTPFYYESQTSVGYFARVFANTNNPFTNPSNAPFDFYGSRADTFHQLTLPQTFFGWLNVTPRVGGRFTYYGEESGPGGTNSDHAREVFNTGSELSFKASRTWPGFQSALFDMDGARHILVPSLDYSYVPRPNAVPSQLPQFDYELTNSLRLLPLEFPEYNSIDSINRQNTIRYGVNNRIQTKRNGEIEDLLNWGLYMDWNLRPRPDQTTFSDIYSDLSLRPRTWLTASSFVRYSIENSQFNLSQHVLTFQPNNTWNWSVGHLYLRNGPLFGTGDNLFTSIFFYRLNENWGTRVAHYFDANHGTLQEQDYTIYRDLRSWTAALTFRALNNLSNGKDYTVAFTFSFKSFPRFTPGQDTVRSSTLLGY